MEERLYYYNCICKNYTETIISKTKLIQCQFCNLFSHKKCVQYLTMKENFICPECQLLLLNPLVKIQKILLSPTFLTFENNEKTKKNSLKHPFKDMDIFTNIFPNEYSSDNNSDINNSKNKNIFSFNIPDDYFIFESNENSINYFIVIYCLKLEGYGFKNEWPENTKLFINENKRKFLGSQKKLIDNTKRYLPIIFSYSSLTELFFPNVNNIYKKNDSENFMKINSIGLVKDCFSPGENNIRFSFEDNSTSWKNNLKNNLYIITIRREYIITPEFVINTIKKNSYAIFYSKKLIKTPMSRSKEFKEKFFMETFRSKGFFCCHFELFDVLKILKKYNSDGMPLICPICKKIIGNFILC